MATLGELESTVMNALWNATTELSAVDIRDALTAASSATGGKELAVTTVLTVLSRLEKKGFVLRERLTRPHLYRAASSRATYMAELMHEVLGSAPDREAVLAQFVGGVSAAESLSLRRLLDQH